MGYLGYIATSRFDACVTSVHAADRPLFARDAEHCFMQLSVSVAQAADIIQVLSDNLSDSAQSRDTDISLLQGALAILGVSSARLDVIERFVAEQIKREHHGATSPEKPADSGFEAACRPRPADRL